MNVPDQRWPDPSPMRNDPEPTDAEIQAYAAYLNPLLLKSPQDVGEMLASMTCDGNWEDFAMMLNAGNVTCMAFGKELLNKAATEDAERIASDILYGDDDHADTLRRIGADDAATFFKRLDEERMV